MTDPEQPSRWPKRALVANAVALLLALLSAAVWLSELIPSTLRRFSNPIVERSAVIFDTAIWLAIIGLGVAIPVVGLVISRRKSRAGAGCGCAVAVFSALLSLLGLLILLALSGVAVH